MNMERLIHEEIRFPPFVDIANKVTNEGNVIGFHRFSHQFHMRFIRRAVPFVVIAGNTGCNEIFPRFLSPPCSWTDMVYSQREISSAAILAPVTVASKDIFTGKDYFLIGDMNIDTKANNAGKRHGKGN
jgi:hypothetical protein